MKKQLFAILIFITMIFVGCSKTKIEVTPDEEVKVELPSKEPIIEEPIIEEPIIQEPSSEVSPSKEPTDTSVDTLSPTPTVITEEPVIQGLAEDILKNLTLEEKIGQLFIVNFELLDNSNGDFYEWRSSTKKMLKNLKKYHIGGVIFFARNIETREQTQKFITNLQLKSKIPLFVSVDEEGGDVARIGNNTNMQTTKFPSMEEVGELNDQDYAYIIGSTIGKEIKELGFNLNFAPVADVKTNEDNTEIGNRSFSSDQKVVANMVKKIVQGIQDEGISATLKHFPGHGDTSEDSHYGSVNVENDIERLRKIEFVPFKAGIKAGVDFIMVSHISISRITETTLPASLSPLVLGDMLRTELEFEGIAITDAFNMKSITDKYSAKKAAVTAISSGADIVLMPENLEQAYLGVLEAVNSGKIEESRIDDAVRRILRTKIRRGLILEDTNLLVVE